MWRQRLRLQSFLLYSIAGVSTFPTSPLLDTFNTEISLYLQQWVRFVFSATESVIHQQTIYRGISVLKPSKRGEHEEPVNFVERDCKRTR